jgi:hypothetical protein
MYIFNIKVFLDVKPCKQTGTSISEEPVAHIFRLLLGEGDLFMI